MQPAAMRNPSTLPLHVLFPADYEASKRMIIRDFAMFGLSIVTLVVGVVTIYG